MAKRQEREDFWMRELKTIQPYGLNDNVRSVGNISKLPQEPVVWSFFHRRSRARKHKPRRHPRSNPRIENPKEWLINHVGNYKSMCFLNKYTTSLFTFKSSTIKQINHIVDDLIVLNEFPNHLLLIARDIARFRLRDFDKVSDDTTASKKHFLKVTFHNKGIEMVNLSSIVHSKQVSKTVPQFFQHKEPPVISYKYTKTIGPTIFNFRRVAREHNVDSLVANSCQCSQSAFLYQPLGHVITGDLRIIKNRKLRQLVTKGPGFREQNNINWDLCRKLCFEGVDRYKKQWASRENVALATLDEWACTVKQLIENRIARLRSRRHKTRKRQILRDAICRRALEELHDRYVLVPADKASNNVIIVCKQYYKEVLTRELVNDTGVSTYVRCSKQVSEIVESHLSFMSKNHINVEDEFAKLPNFYWLPKMHKTPYKHRFIAASSACTTKPLSKLLTLGLKLLLQHYKQYCAGIERRTGVNCFWVINNSTEVLQNLNKVNRAFALDSFDFSTLYTNIPHNLLKTRIRQLVIEAFTCRNANYIQVNRDYACWSNTASVNSRTHSLTAGQFIDLFNFLIDNIFIQVGSIVFQQAIGIPMGTDCAPLVADLFLFSFEFEFMRTLIRTDFSVARKFSKTFRYIDDLLTLNNPEFSNFIGHIYPQELELKKTTESPENCSYLDLSISIVNHKFATDLYDKRETFNFTIVNFPHMDSNIPSKPAYGVFISQLVRYLRVCGNYQQFNNRSTKLSSRLQKQGFDFAKLRNTFKKFLQRYPTALCKYGKSHKNMIVECVSVPLFVFPSKCCHVFTR